MRSRVAAGCRAARVVEERFRPGGQTGERRPGALGPRIDFGRRDVVVERTPREIAGDAHEPRPGAAAEGQAIGGGKCGVDLGRRVRER